MHRQLTGREPASAAPSRLPGPIPYELRIGVTGHRELADPPAVERAVRELIQHVVDVLERASAEPLGPQGSPQSRGERFDRFLTKWLAAGTRLFAPGINVLTAVLAAPLRWSGVARATRTFWPQVPYSPERPEARHRTPLKLTVITALAQGADQIVARAVCDLVERPEERNRYLEAVLPFAPSLYEEDFTAPEDRDRFRALLALDRGRYNTHPEPTVLFPDFPACPDPENPAHPLSRDDAFAAAGRYVVDACEILVAIWNPLREEKPGGTGAATRYAVDRGRVVLWLNPDDLAAGPSMLRKAPYPGDGTQPATGRDAPRGLRAEPVPARAKQLSRDFHRLAAYNRDAAVEAGSLAHEVGEHAERMEKVALECGVPRPAVHAVIEQLLPHVVRADHLSMRYKELRESAAWLWPLAAAAVVSLMAFQIIFLPEAYWLAFIELAVLVTGYLSYRVSLHDAWHEKWLNDRRLAEALRGAMFAALASSGDAGERDVRGVGSGVRRSIPDPLPFYNPANAWFVATLKRIVGKQRRPVSACLDVRHAAHRAAVAAFLRRAWVDDQAAYHARNAVARRLIVKRFGRLRLALIVASIGVAAAHAFGIGHGEAGAGGSRFAELDLWVAFATVALPAWAAAAHVRLTQDDHERLAERSDLMVPLLRGLGGQLEQVGTAEQLRACVAEAERLMDLESREWAESLVDRKPEFTG